MKTLLAFGSLLILLIVSKGVGGFSEERFAHIGTVEDVQNLNVSETWNGEVRQLRISGLAFHSSLAAKKMTPQVDGWNLLDFWPPTPLGSQGARFFRPIKTI